MQFNSPCHAIFFKWLPQHRYSHIHDGLQDSLHIINIRAAGKVCGTMQINVK